MKKYNNHTKPKIEIVNGTMILKTYEGYVPNVVTNAMNIGQEVIMINLYTDEKGKRGIESLFVNISEEKMHDYRYSLIKGFGDKFTLKKVELCELM